MHNFGAETEDASLKPLEFEESEWEQLSDFAGLRLSKLKDRFEGRPFVLNARGLGYLSEIQKFEKHVLKKSLVPDAFTRL